MALATAQPHDRVINESLLKKLKEQSKQQLTSHMKIIQNLISHQSNPEQLVLKVKDSNTEATNKKDVQGSSQPNSGPRTPQNFPERIKTMFASRNSFAAGTSVLASDAMDCAHTKSSDIRMPGEDIQDILKSKKAFSHRYQGNSLPKITKDSSLSDFSKVFKSS